MATMTRLHKANLEIIRKATVALKRAVAVTPPSIRGKIKETIPKIEKLTR